MDARLLVASDMHGSAIGLAALVEECEKEHYDGIILCGDITHFGPLTFASMVLSELEGLGADVFYVGGNCDPKDVELLGERMGPRVASLHRKGLAFKGLGLVGHGGSTGWGGPREYISEDEVGEGLVAGLEQLPKDRGRGPSPVDVLVTHTPALGSLDLTPSGERIGSSSVKGFIERYRPAVALSGHVHEDRGIQRRGGTLHVNPGPLGMGYFARLDVAVGEKDVVAKARLLD